MRIEVEFTTLVSETIEVIMRTTLDIDQDVLLAVKELEKLNRQARNHKCEMAFRSSRQVQAAVAVWTWNS
jgi:hypothetical protein